MSTEFTQAALRASGLVLIAVACGCSSAESLDGSGSKESDAGTVALPSWDGPCIFEQIFDEAGPPGTERLSVSPWNTASDNGTLTFGRRELGRTFVRAQGSATARGPALAALTHRLLPESLNVEVTARFSSSSPMSGFAGLITIRCSGLDWNPSYGVGINDQGLFFVADGSNRVLAEGGDSLLGQWATFKILVEGNRATLKVGAAVVPLTATFLPEGPCVIDLGVNASGDFPEVTADIAGFCQH